MIDKIKLEILIDNDPELEQLVKEANSFHGTYTFPATADEVYHFCGRSPSFKKLSTEEFFATYKCMIALAVMMSRVLTNIHGTNENDFKKAFNLAWTTKTKKGLIYYGNAPSFVPAWGGSSVDDYIYITVPLKVVSGYAVDIGEIQFRFTGPLIVYDPKTNTYIPKLLSSVMEVEIKYEDKNKYRSVEVWNFNRSWLSTLIDQSGMGD